MAKKYLLVRNPDFFDSMEEVTAYASRLKAEHIEGLFVGPYVGELHLDTNMVLRNNSKVKKLKIRDVKKEIPPTTMPLQETEGTEEEEVQLDTLQCSFCHRPGIKTIVIDKRPTHMCMEHLSVEKDLFNAAN